MPRSQIRAIMDLAWSLGEDVVRLEVGEPDFDTPRHVVEAASRAAASGQTRYLPNAGLGDLRDALAHKLTQRNGLAASGTDVVVTAGAVQALHATMAALLEPGSGILLPDPGWPDFAMQAHLLDLYVQPYELDADTDYLPDLYRLERQVESRTRALLLNSPSNPLGTVLHPKLIADLVDFAERHDLWIISDEVYDEIAFDLSFASVAAVAPSPRIVSIYSFSKVYAMTGWRVGYLTAAPPIVDLLTAVQEPLVSCVNAPAQHAALAAVTGPQDFVADARDTYRSRRDLAVGLLRDAGLDPVVPEGTFYVWVRLPADLPPTADLVRDLLLERRVAVAPGSAFGACGERHLRISIASSPQDLEQGIDRLRGWLAAS